MPFLVYILWSDAAERFYCGSTSSLNRRLRQHNDPAYDGSLTTKRFPGPWRLFWSEDHGTRAEAMAAERAIKKRGIARFLEERGAGI